MESSQLTESNDCKQAKEDDYECTQETTGVLTEGKSAYYDLRKRVEKCFKESAMINLQ